MKLRLMALAAAIAASATAMTDTSASAQEAYLGEIRPMAFTFCPRGWAEAKGQILSIAENNNLFWLIGDTFGGDGRTTFALPDLRGRVAMGAGQGIGLSERQVGQMLGRETAAAADDNDSTQKTAVTPPVLVVRYCIATQGVFPSRP